MKYVFNSQLCVVGALVLGFIVACVALGPQRLGGDDVVGGACGRCKDCDTGKSCTDFGLCGGSYGKCLYESGYGTPDCSYVMLNPCTGTDCDVSSCDGC